MERNENHVDLAGNSNGVQSFEQVLEKKGYLMIVITGNSMYPMLRNRRDVITVSKVQGRLKKYDVPLYKKNDRYILHRIIKVLPESYEIRGDNCIQKEYVADSQIIGVLTGFRRDGREMDTEDFIYRLYARIWVMINPLLRTERRVKRKIRTLLH